MENLYRFRDNDPRDRRVGKYRDTVLSYGKDLTCQTFVYTVSLFFCPFAVIGGKTLLSHFKNMPVVPIAGSEIRKLMVAPAIAHEVDNARHDLI